MHWCEYVGCPCNILVVCDCEYNVKCVQSWHMIKCTGLKITVTVTLNMMTLATAAVLQELLLNGGSVAPMKPFSQQMGVADKYEGVAADAARMAMSHPAMLDHADRPHVQFGSVAQFKVTRAAATPATGVMCAHCRRARGGTVPRSTWR